MALKEKLESLPDKPGVYLFRDMGGNVIYVGKAISLKNRVRSYFQSSKGHSPKTQRLVERIRDLEYIIVDSEVEALILEYNLIKEHRPLYNVRLKDDKSYPYIKITVNEPFPRVMMTRKVKRDGAKYFGPYTHVGAAKETLDFLQKLFQVRGCNREIKKSGDEKPCLNYHIERCSAPCAGKISEDEYNELIQSIRLFLEGKSSQLIKQLQDKMKEASDELNFEEAALLRDKLLAMSKVQERQKIVSTSGGDMDLVALSSDHKRALVQVFFVREGRLIGRQTFTLSADEEDHPQEMMAAFLKQYYGSATFIPSEILLQYDVEDSQAIASWLAELKGSKVELKVPQRGEKRALLDMVIRNANFLLSQEQLKEEKMRIQTQGALIELAEILNIEGPIDRIEGFDISNIQGQGAVGSMVVFEGGQPRPDEYKKFKIHSLQGPDDVAMMRQVLTRRSSHKEDEEWKKPDLILVDGGIGQLNAACEVFRVAGLTDIPIISLAEEDEEIYTEGDPIPLSLPRESPALQLLQRVRDEAHRFALSYHRSLRRKKTLTSALDDIPGIGEKRRRALLKEFGSVEGIKKAQVEELARVPGMNRSVAQRVYDTLKKNREGS